jgi:hypothetical protein
MATLRTTHNFNGDYNKVAVIKALRNLAGLGLKESKDGVELAATGVPFEFACDVVLRDHHYGVTEAFSENGFVLVELASKTSIVLQSVKESAIFATKEGENDLARLLLNVLMDYEQILKGRDAEKVELIESRKYNDHADKARHEELEQFQHARDMRNAAFEETKRDKKEQEERMRKARNK